MGFNIFSLGSGCRMIREIAQQLETTLGSVAGLLRRGVQLLYEQLPVGLLPSGDGHEDRGADHVE